MEDVIARIGPKGFVLVAIDHQSSRQSAHRTLLLRFNDDAVTDSCNLIKGHLDIQG